MHQFSSRNNTTSNRRPSILMYQLSYQKITCWIYIGVWRNTTYLYIYLQPKGRCSQETNEFRIYKLINNDNDMK